MVSVTALTGGWWSGNVWMPAAFLFRSAHCHFFQLSLDGVTSVVFVI